MAIESLPDLGKSYSVQPKLLGTRAAMWLQEYLSQGFSSRSYLARSHSQIRKTQENRVLLLTAT